MAENRLIHVGFGNIVNAEKIIAIVSPDSAPVRRLVSNAKNSGRAIDATQGRKTKSVIVMENDRIVLSALLPETIRGRAMADSGAGDSETRDPGAGESSTADPDEGQADPSDPGAGKGDPPDPGAGGAEKS